MPDEIPVKQIGELLDSVTDRLPKMLIGLMDTMYSAEAGKKMGQAVGNLFKELVDSGIPKEDAIKIAKDYMLSLKDITGSFTNYNNGKKQNKHDDDDDD